MNPRDEELLAEILLLTDLMIAANEADGQVPPDTLDVILAAARLAREPTSPPPLPRQRPSLHTQDGDARRERMRTVENEITIQRRAVELQEAAVARFTELGELERADTARRRLQRARKLLRLALERDGAQLQHRYGAMGDGSGPDAVGHAVEDGSAVSACGMEVLLMVSVATFFSSLPAERQCSYCAAAIAVDH